MRQENRLGYIVLDKPINAHSTQQEPFKGRNKNKIKKGRKAERRGIGMGIGRGRGREGGREGEKGGQVSIRYVLIDLGKYVFPRGFLTSQIQNSEIFLIRALFSTQKQVSNMNFGV